MDRGRFSVGAVRRRNERRKSTGGGRRGMR